MEKFAEVRLEVVGDPVEGSGQHTAPDQQDRHEDVGGGRREVHHLQAKFSEPELQERNSHIDTLTAMEILT